MDTSLSFEELMHKGMDAHANRNYVEALGYRLQAFRTGAPEIWDRARAARDISASFDRLGDANLADDTYSNPVSNRDLAEAYAEYAYRDHKALHEQGIERGSREFTVSAMYKAIDDARQNREIDARETIKEAWDVSEALYQKYGKWHQYDVNLIGRVVGIESTFGGKPIKHIRKLGKLATQLAKLSETNQVLEPDSTKSAEAVTNAQHKAKWRGRAARSIVMLSWFPAYESTTKPIAVRILNRVVL